jgi:ABC-type transport system involved in cytochrome c biogenesis ATPase subunit
MSGPRIVTHDRRFFRELSLQNLTVFGQADFTFIPQGMNVFVGENGTGKTHAMKVLYAWMLAQSFRDARDWGFVVTLLRVMQAAAEEDLVRHGEDQAAISLSYGDSNSSEVLFDRKTKRGLRGDLTMADIPRPVFIPAVEMLGHSKGFGDTFDVHGVDFDYTFREIVRLLNVTSPQPSPDYNRVIGQLEERALNGKVEYDRTEDRFYLSRKDERFPMPMVAEGLRKLATLSRLLINGSIHAGTTLFWDEPEVNLNPKLMDELVDALLAVVRSGVQVFIATHSYIVLEEIADRSKSGEVRYFGFEPTPQGATVRWTDELAKLSPNPILDQYEDLSNRKLRKAFGRENQT